MVEPLYPLDARAERSPWLEGRIPMPEADSGTTSSSSLESASVTEVEDAFSVMFGILVLERPLGTAGRKLLPDPVD